MSIKQLKQSKVKHPLIQLKGVRISSWEGRELFRNLNMSVSDGKVAIIGRNGVGKSTLLEVISGQRLPDDGYASISGDAFYVPQRVDLSEEGLSELISRLGELSSSQHTLEAALSNLGFDSGQCILTAKHLSPGEARKLNLLMGSLMRPSLMLLDEPSQDLDEQGILWLRSWLSSWQVGICFVVSHDPRILKDFNHFFVVSESGCRLYEMSFNELQDQLYTEYYSAQKHYVRNLNRLVDRETHTLHIARRRARKKQYGRVSELGRATPRMRLNQKRDYAQVKHGRMKRGRDARLAKLRDWTQSTRNMLKVELPMTIQVPVLDNECGEDLIRLKHVSLHIGKRVLFEDINITQRRERIAVVGDNGTGKTSLLNIVSGLSRPTSGDVYVERNKIAYVQQGAENWNKKESLYSTLTISSSNGSEEEVTKALLGHKFPLALARRPMTSLSPGERFRAALVSIFMDLGSVQCLILDEPTAGLDLFGRMALIDVLNAWSGGLMITSHDADFISEVGVNQIISLN